MSTIITRNSAISGSIPSSLVQGELAINVTDGRLFYGSGSGNVVKEFTVSGSGGQTFPYTGSAIISGSLSITGSLSIITGSSIVFNTATYTLTDSSANSSVGWGKRNLFDATSRLAVDWASRFLYDSNSTPKKAADWKVRILYDASTSSSLNWTARTLYDTTQLQSLDWSARALADSNESASVSWQERTLNDSGAPGGSGIPVLSIDWETRNAADQVGNSSINWDTRNLFDGSAIQSIDWTNRAQYDQFGNVIIDYSGANSYSISNYRPTIEDLTTVVQDEFTQTTAYSIDTNVAGNLINVDANVDLAVTASNPVFLDIDGIWKRTDQTTDTTTKLLGICVGPYNKGVILSEGIITVTTSSGYSDITPFVSGSNFYGMPVYLTGSTATFTTDKPTSGYVRVVGHMYYNSTSNPDYWIMKFNPSNDWYEI